MLQIDDRAGSDRLYRRLSKVKGLPVECVRLQYGDAAFLGIGPEQRPIPVGIEHKQVEDVLQCIGDGRFSGHQLPGLMQSYECVILMVGGVTRPSHPDGLLELRSDKGYWYRAKAGSRNFMYSALANWLNTLQFKVGVRVMRTSCMEESACAIASIYSWWGDAAATGNGDNSHAGWDSHHSHLTIQSPIELDQINFRKPSLVRRWASCLPGMGATRSAAVARQFPSAFAMALADEREWREIDGVGRDTAAKVVSAIRNGG